MRLTNKKIIVILITVLLLLFGIIFIFFTKPNASSDELTLQKVEDILIGAGEAADDGSTQLVVQLANKIGFVNRQGNIIIVNEDGTKQNLGNFGTTSFDLSSDARYLSVNNEHNIGLFEIPLKQLSIFTATHAPWVDKDKYGKIDSLSSTNMPVFDVTGTKVVKNIAIPSGTYAINQLGSNLLLRYNYREGYFDAQTVKNSGQKINEYSNVTLAASDASSGQVILLENYKYILIKSDGLKKELNVPPNNIVAIKGDTLYRAIPSNRDVEFTKTNLNTMVEEKLGKVSSRGTPSGLYLVGDTIMLNSQDTLWMVKER